VCKSLLTRDLLSTEKLCNFCTLDKYQSVSSLFFVLFCTTEQKDFRRAFFKQIFAINKFIEIMLA